MDQIELSKKFAHLIRVNKGKIKNSILSFTFIADVDTLDVLDSLNDDFHVAFDITKNVYDREILTIGSSYQFEVDFDLIRRSHLCFFLDWDDFLKHKINLSIIPPFFYIVQSNDLYIEGEDGSENQNIRCYLDTVDLIYCLDKCCDHSEISASNEKNYYFLYKSKIIIECKYTYNDIKHGIDGITTIKSWLEQEEHAEQRVSIFKSSLYELLKKIDDSSKFSFFVKNFGAFSKAVIEDYNLYVSEFSFDKVRLEYKEKKREYIVKINDTFNTIQTKALGIPVSICLVALKNSSSATLKNTPSSDFLIYCAVYIYAAMMFLLIVNQMHSLITIRDEVNDQERRLKNEFYEQYADIKSEFSSVYFRYRLQLLQMILFIFLIVGFVYLVDYYMKFNFFMYLRENFEFVNIVSCKINSLICCTFNYCS
ncbi:hypothetical protein [Shewanella algae]|uniref:hypothetical protein n=1 Tax=Shewanella algae TaxID=38313 RepID=UPI001AAD05B4|nr:hypothetical protein [Shewanella algae]MBO2563775.1 hypothetical protein [Shewanella algae]